MNVGINIRRTQRLNLLKVKWLHLNYLPFGLNRAFTSYLFLPTDESGSPGIIFIKDLKGKHYRYELQHHLITFCN